MKHFILATAGHVDHGKSALVKALTGTDPDRLPEEKARGITIELGFAQLEFPDTNVGIVDVPGHEDFVKNMVAGVGSIDLALLVVAADDGWMPQTEEHLQILIYLGVRRVVVALTKIDLVKSEETAENEVRAQLTDTPFSEAAIVRTCVSSLRGIEELKAQLVREFESLTPQPDIGKSRLAVDRAFALRGIGTVVTGTLTGGKLRRSQAVLVQPSDIPARIRSIQNHGRNVDQIGPGARTALNLSDVAIARKKGERGIWRGDIVTLSEFGDAWAVVDAMLTRSARLPVKTKALEHGATVRVHHGTSNWAARIFFQSGEQLRAGESEIAQVRFDAPVFMFAGDRFVVRDSSEQNTIAGGTVLDPDATVTNFRSDAQQKLLKERAHALESVVVFVRTQLVRDHFVRRAEVLLKSYFGRTAIANAITELSRGGIAIGHGELVIDAKWWRDLRTLAVAAIEEDHKAHPHRFGLELARLRDRLARQISSLSLFDLLVSDLCSDGFVRTGETIRCATHRPTLPPSLQEATARVRTALAARPFDPPSRKELAPDAISQQALRFLLDTGEAVEISNDLVLGSAEFAEMRKTVIKVIRSKGPASVSDLRRALGSSRRVVVPMLEQLDREGVTRRSGDSRILK